MWYGLASGQPHHILFNLQAFLHCTRPFSPWRDEIFESEPNPGVKGKDASYYCFNVMYWYFGAKTTQKQLSGCCRSSWQTNKSLAVQWACTLCLSKPIHPSLRSPLFFFWKQHASSKASSRRPACMESVCSAFKEKEQRYQSAATMLLLQTPPHFGEEAGIIAGVYSKSWMYS